MHSLGIAELLQRLLQTEHINVLIVKLEPNAAILSRMRIEELITVDGCHQQRFATVQRLGEAQQTCVSPEELDTWLTWRGRQKYESQCTWS